VTFLLWLIFKLRKSGGNVYWQCTTNRCRFICDTK